MAMTWQEEAAALLGRRNEVLAKEAAGIVTEIATRHAISTVLLLSPCRLPEVVAARREAAEELHMKGLTSADIGLVLNRDRSSVVNLLGRLRRQRLRVVA
jgi:hypothetical protein